MLVDSLDLAVCFEVVPGRFPSTFYNLVTDMNSARTSALILLAVLFTLNL